MVVLQAGVKHIILAVSYRAEMLEKEMREQEEKVKEGREGEGEGRGREGEGRKKEGRGRGGEEKGGEGKGRGGKRRGGEGGGGDVSRKGREEETREGGRGEGGVRKIPWSATSLLSTLSRLMTRVQIHGNKRTCTHHVTSVGQTKLEGMRVSSIKLAQIF